MTGAIVTEERKRWRPGALFWVVAILCVAYLPIFLGQILFFRDPAHWNYPARWFVRESLWRGDLPWWNPEQGLGFAVLANPLYGLFYPPHWLYLLTPRALVASMVTWQAFAHVVWGSAGMVVLARQLRAASIGAGVAGLAWGLSGFTTALWTTGLLLHSGSWLPWCAVGFVSLARRADTGVDGWASGVARAAAPLAMAILFGEVFAAIISAGFGLALAALVVERPLRPRLARLGSAALAALALAGGIGAVVVLPARVIAAATLRGQPLARAVAETCSFHPLRLIEMAAPGSMGYAYGEYAAAPWIGEKLLDGFPLTYSVYLGASVLALALLAFGRRRGLAAALGALSVFILLLAFGRFTPVHNVFRTIVRPLAYMRYPEKYLVGVVACVALLAGLGATRVFAERSLAWKRGLVLVALLLGLALAAPIFPPRWAHYVRAGALEGAAAAALVLAVQALLGRSARLASLLLVVGLSADLAVAAWPHLGFGPREVATRTPRAAAALLADHRTRPDALAPPRLYRAGRAEEVVRRFVPAASNPEGEVRSMETLIGNTVATFGIATLPGYDAAIPTAVPALWEAGQKMGQSVLRLLSVGYAVLPIENPGDPVEHRTGLEPMLDPLPGARLYRVPTPLPRVFLAGRAEVVSDAQATARLFEPAVIEGRVALLADGAPLGASAERAGACSLVSFGNTRVVARCQAERDAVAVFIEQHDVGWRATVDGAPAPLLRANLLMRAVAVAPGTHTIALSYTPPGLVAGGAVSVISLTLWSAIALLPAVRRWRRRAA